MFTASLKRGLSLTEIMIALTIVAVFALVVVPNFFSYLQRSRVSATEQTLRVTQQTIMAYYSDTNQYPQSLQDLVRRPQDVPVNKWYGPYFQGKDEDYIPVDGWRNELYYRLLDQRSKKPYELYSYGPNGEAGDDSERIYP